MNKNLFVFDLDGTLSTSNLGILPSSIDGINMIKNNGDYFMIATGRPIAFCQNEIETFNPQYLIELSGSIIHDLHNKKILYSSLIPESLSKKLINYSKDNKLIFEMNIGDKTYFISDRDLVPYEVKKYDPKKGYIHCNDCSEEWWEESYKKIIKYCFKFNHDGIESIQKFIDTFKGELNISPTGKGYVDVTHLNDNKWFAIEKVKELLSPKKIITFGDSLNDYKMIKNADIGVAMGNAYKEILDIANLKTNTNDNDGIYKGIIKAYELLNKN